jgi:hypothetical protein
MCEHMDKLRFSPKDARNFKATTAGAGVLAVAMLAGCGFTSDRPIDEVTVTGDNESLQQELEANKGVNVRTYPGIEGPIVGKIAPGTKIENVVVTQGDGGNWVTADCLAMPIDNIQIELIPREGNDPFAPVSETADCFVNGNFVNE